MVTIDDRRSTIDIKNKLFNLDGELILFVALGKERGDDEGQLAMMTLLDIIPMKYDIIS